MVGNYHYTPNKIIQPVPTSRSVKPEAVPSIEKIAWQSSKKKSFKLQNADTITSLTESAGSGNLYMLLLSMTIAYRLIIYFNLKASGQNGSSQPTKILKSSSSFATRTPGLTNYKGKGPRISFADDHGGKLAQNVYVDQLHYSTSYHGKDMSGTCIGCNCSIS